MSLPLTERSRGAVTDEKADDWHAPLEAPKMTATRTRSRRLDPGDADGDRRSEVAEPIDRPTSVTKA